MRGRGLLVGQQIPVIARVSNTGSAPTDAPVTLRVQVPTALTPLEVTIRDVLAYVRGVLDPSGGLTLADEPATTTLTYPIGVLAPGETESVPMRIVVRPGSAGMFTIVGDASIAAGAAALAPAAVDEPSVAPLAEADGVAAATTASDISAELRLQIIPQPAVGQCASSVDGLNVRQTPLIDPINIILPQYRGTLYLSGIYRAPSGDEWYRVVGYAQSEAIAALSGWISASAFNDGNPCNLLGYGVKTDLQYVDDQGMLIAHSATPTPTSTPNISPTPTLPATLYPSLTPGPTPQPPAFSLCPDRDPWLRDLCYQAWNYLTSDQRQQLTSAVNNNFVTTDFIALDAWWLQNIRRGITDVPPQVWQADSLSQCAGNVTCTGIVQDTIFLFENMWRVGVDWANAGEGQIRYDLNRGALLENQELWFLESGDMSAIRNLNEYWG